MELNHHPLNTCNLGQYVIDSETCILRPLWWKNNLWWETTLAGRWLYISVHLYSQWKVTSHIRPLIVESVGCFKSQFSAYIIFWGLLNCDWQHSRIFFYELPMWQYLLYYTYVDYVSTSQNVCKQIKFQQNQVYICL